MDALVNALLLIVVALLPVLIVVGVRYAGRKRGLDDRYQPDDPSQEPDYRKYGRSS